ncbi:MAG TPA: DoxX family membrane protein [Nocardioidaceae bacterium]|nr:DoxX family membrane protein [Nocardioidaceae bacterium]
MTLIRRVARPMLASSFVFGGIQALKNTPALAATSKPVNDEIRDIAGRVAPQVRNADDQTLVRVNAGLHILGGLGLATNKAPRLSALALAATLVPTTAAGHPFWEEKDKAAKEKQTSEFLKNLSMLGGLVLAGVDTNGKPGVLWRATHAVGTATRSVGAATKGAGAASKGVGSAAKGATKGATKGLGAVTSGVAKTVTAGGKSAGTSSQLTRAAKRTAKSAAKDAGRSARRAKRRS